MVIYCSLVKGYLIKFLLEINSQVLFAKDSEKINVNIFIHSKELV